jgi:hypothetical protein
MAATKTAPSTNGSAAASTAVARAKQAGDSVTTAARRAKTPMLAAGATAAGLAGGVALASRITHRPRRLAALVTPRRRVFGIPLGRKSGLVRTAEALGRVAREVGSATSQVSATTDELREVREQLDKANRQSPVEVLLDGLTHRRGAHKRES